MAQEVIPIDTKTISNPLSDLGRIKDSLIAFLSSTGEVTKLIMPSPDDKDFTWEQNWYGGVFEKTAAGESSTVELKGHCFSTSYLEGTLGEGRCALYIETSLIKATGRHIKEVGVEISVVCHRGLIRLSDEEKTRYQAMGIYGNRLDSAVQAIHRSVLSAGSMDTIREHFSIGGMNLAENEPIRQLDPGAPFFGKIIIVYLSVF